MVQVDSASKARGSCSSVVECRRIADFLICLYWHRWKLHHGDAPLPFRPPTPIVEFPASSLVSVAFSAPVIWLFLAIHTADEHGVDPSNVRWLNFPALIFGTPCIVIVTLGLPDSWALDFCCSNLYFLFCFLSRSFCTLYLF